MRVDRDNQLILKAFPLDEYLGTSSRDILDCPVYNTTESPGTTVPGISIPDDPDEIWYGHLQALPRRRGSKNKFSVLSITALESVSNQETEVAIHVLDVVPVDSSSAPHVHCRARFSRTFEGSIGLMSDRTGNIFSFAGHCIAISPSQSNPWSPGVLSMIELYRYRAVSLNVQTQSVIVVPFELEVSANHLFIDPLTSSITYLTDSGIVVQHFDGRSREFDRKNVFSRLPIARTDVEVADRCCIQ